MIPGSFESLFADAGNLAETPPARNNTALTVEMSTRLVDRDRVPIDDISNLHHMAR